MNVNRRSFLFGLGAVAIATQIPNAVIMPTLAEPTGLPKLGRFRKLCNLSVGGFDQFRDYRDYLTDESYRDRAVKTSLYIVGPGRGSHPSFERTLNERASLCWSATPGHELLVRPVDTVRIDIEPKLTPATVMLGYTGDSKRDCFLDCYTFDRQGRISTERTMMYAPETV